MTFDLLRLIEVGGKEWKRDSRHRIYFDDIAFWYGLQCKTDPHTGRVVSATLDGLNIETTEARELLIRLKAVRVWYDVGKQTFTWPDVPDITRVAEKIVAAIMKALPPEQAPDPSRVHEYGSTFHVDASVALDAALKRKDPDAVSQARSRLALIKPRPSPLVKKIVKREPPSGSGPGPS
jgi:hypothetical protein